MATVSFTAVGVALYWSYKTDVEENRIRMQGIARSQAALIRSLTPTHEPDRILRVVDAANLEQLHESATGEFLVARQEGDQIVFLLARRGPTEFKLPSVPLEGPLAESARRGLKGESGTLIGPDYRGHTVVAAYEPVQGLNWVVVSKIDLGEIRAALLPRASMVGLLVLGAVVLGAILFLRVSEPLVERLEESEKQFRAVFNQTFQFLWLLGPNGRLLEANQAALDAVGVVPAAVKGRLLWQLRWWDGLPAQQSEVQKAVAEAAAGNLVRRELEARGFGDRRMALDFSLKPLTDRDGRVVQLLAEGRDITERKKAEKELARRTAYLNGLIQGSPLGIVAHDTEGNVRFCNPAFERLFGFTQEELSGKPLDTCISPAERGAEAAELTRRVVLGESFRLTTQRRRRDGTLVDVLLHGVPLVVEGKPVGGFGFYEDITEQRRAEETRNRLATILEATTDMVGLSTVDGRATYINAAGRKLLALPEDLNIVGQPIEQFVPPSARKFFLEEVLPAALQKGAWSGESAVLRRDGKEVPVSQVVIAPPTAPGQEPYLATVIRDLSDRKRWEAELAQRTAFLHALIENSPLAVVVLDAENRVTLCNPAFERVFQYREEEVIGVELDSLVAAPETMEEAADITKRSKSGELIHTTGQRRRRDGSRVEVEIFGVPLMVKGEMRGAYAIYQDITERRRHEAERERLVKELQEALANVKTLRGLLPICASCKNVRDDQGYWNRIETYLSAHSEAEFSHGICPDCARRLYPEQFAKMYPELAEKEPIEE
ncbi:MAG TPA: PAS domain S-box protein [Candidatus Xenobia bacterium]|nr:PAS domain S-box protein [Candidatus Xenobia bacterium]